MIPLFIYVESMNLKITTNESRTNDTIHVSRKPKRKGKYDAYY